MLLVYAFSLFWLILFIILLLKKCKYATLTYIVGIWLFSSIASIIYVLEISISDEIEIIPYIFLIACLLCAFIPYTIPNQSIPSVCIGNERLFKQIIIIIGFISILPFLENLYHVISTYGASNTDSLADMYEDKMSGDFDKSKSINWFSFLGEICNSINLKFQFCSMFLLFLYLSKDTFSKKNILLLLVIVLNPILYALGLSGRASLVFNIIRAGLLYAMLYTFINNDVKKLIVKYGVLFIAAGISLLMVMTLARYNNNQGANSIPLVAWMALYAGEGSVNFTNYMWNTLCFSEGDTCFSFFKSLLGFDTFDFFSRREYWGPRMGINPARFYTFVGDLFADIGYITLPLLFVIGTAIKKRIINNKTVTVLFLYIYYSWAYLCISGITIYTFKTSTSTIDFLVSLVIVYFISKPSNNKTYLCNKI